MQISGRHRGPLVYARRVRAPGGASPRPGPLGVDWELYVHLLKRKWPAGAATPELL